MSKVVFLLTLQLGWLGLFSCTTSPTGRKQLVLVSDQQMSAMGAQAFGALKKETPLDRDKAQNLYVRCIVTALAPFVEGSLASTDWEVVVFKSQEVNAFALPGGKIGVYTGMFGVAKTPSQLAAVLGHEIGHVIARHGAERVSTQLMAQSGLMVADILAGDHPQKKNILGALGIGAQFGIVLPHSRKQESEADRIGLELMARAGFDPRESVQLWMNMSANRGGAEVPEILSTHPADQHRISQLQSDMGKALALYQEAQRNHVQPACRLHH